MQGIGVKKNDSNCYCVSGFWYLYYTESVLCQQNKILTPIRDVFKFSHENPVKEESRQQAINYLF